MTNRRERVCVIGAGVAGLVAARGLAAHDRAVVVFDKGRGPGGRSSRRRRAVFEFDHGAQYFTAREPRFREAVDVWINEGWAAPWEPRVVAFELDEIAAPQRETVRYVGVPGMNAIARGLAADLDVRQGVRVRVVQRATTAAGGTSDASEAWRLVDDAGHELGEFDTLLLTPPPAQSAELLRDAGPDTARTRNTIGAVRMEPCWAALFGFAERVSVDFDAAFVNCGALQWVARNSSKPGRASAESWVLHASPRWSEEHRSVDRETVAGLLQRELAALCRRAGCDQLPAVVVRDAHFWAYSKPVETLPQTCMFEARLRLGVAGDWCGGPKIEGAFLSGSALADAVLAQPRPA